MRIIKIPGLLKFILISIGVISICIFIGIGLAIAILGGMR